MSQPSCLCCSPATHPLPHAVCNNSTFHVCMEQQMFGLPQAHWCYVQVGGWAWVGGHGAFASCCKLLWPGLWIKGMRSNGWPAGWQWRAGSPHTQLPPPAPALIRSTFAQGEDLPCTQNARGFEAAVAGAGEGGVSWVAVGPHAACLSEWRVTAPSSVLHLGHPRFPPYCLPYPCLPGWTAASPSTCSSWMSCNHF